MSAQTSASQAHETKILYDLGLLEDKDVDQNNNDDDGNGYTGFDDSPVSTWISVFGEENPDFPAPSGAASAIEDDGDDLADCNTCPRDAEGNAVNTTGAEEWKNLFGGEVVGSQYQDGHFVYQVVAGGGSGSDVYPPVLFVADIENATHFNNVLEP